MKKYVYVLAVLIVATIGVRAALPVAIQKYLVNTLNGIPNTQAEIKDIDLNLWRGAYEIEGLSVRQGADSPPDMMISAKLIDLSVEWKELFHGAIVGEILLDEPVIEINGSKKKDVPKVAEEKPAGQAAKAKEALQEKKDWQDMMKAFFPVDINRFEVKSGQVRFQNPHAEVPINLSMRNLDILAKNLTNSRNNQNVLVSTISGQGTVMDHGVFLLNVAANPLQETPTFDLNLKVENVDAPELNGFLEHYAGINLEGGNLGVYVECAAREGRMTGYVKPIFKDLKIFGDPQQKLSLGEKTKEFFAEIAAKILRNDDKETLATRIEFDGKFDDPQVSVWTAVVQTLRHAFVQALLPSIEDSVTLKDA